MFIEKAQNKFDSALAARLEQIEQQGLLRTLRRIDSPQSARLKVDGRLLLNFSSNDYLGLADEPALREAAQRAIQDYGAGAGASRLICGSLAPHHELEEALAAFKGTDAALSFSSGYAAAVGTITALLGKGDIIVLDKLDHACVVDAARLSGAQLRVFAHNDLDDLESILAWANKTRASKVTAEGSRSLVLVVTESVFSMDGDHAPLRQIVELKDRYGAWLMVDEAHATGLYGANRRGLSEELGASARIEIQMGTLGKALGASGGFICGSRKLIDYLVNSARSFIFSTAPVPAAAAAATAGIRFVQSAAGAARQKQLWERVAQFEGRAGLATASHRSAIIPLMVGNEAQAMETAAQLLRRGILIPAIRYPTVARGAARLRLTFTATHSPEDVRQLLLHLNHSLPTHPSTAPPPHPSAAPAHITAVSEPPG